jgi:C1A family cysteine protease
MTRQYGLLKSSIENLDAIKKYSLDLGVGTQLPPSVDLRPIMPPVYDQGQTSSCTANAIAGAMQFLTKSSVVPSRMFIYYNERLAMNETMEDSGASLDIGIPATKQYGACPESLWDFDVAHITEKPTPEDYALGLQCTIDSFEHILTFDQIKHSLSLGFPVIVGITAYQSFESEQTAKTGLMTIPLPTEACLGGHAVLVVGYDDVAQHLIVRNSWGNDWGQNGYFFMPYAYAQNSNLCYDWFSIQTVGTETATNSEVLV